MNDFDMGYFNTRIVGHPELKFTLDISEFPDAIKTQDQIMDGRAIKQFACYTHPDFKRFDPYFGEIDYVAVFDGKIVGPSFDKLKKVIELKDQLLSL